MQEQLPDARASPNVHGRTAGEPRNAIAHSQGRMPGERAVRGVFLCLLSLHKHCAAGAARTAELAPKGRRAGRPESRE
jgi:hypothetical protein